MKNLSCLVVSLLMINMLTAQVREKINFNSTKLQDTRTVFIELPANYGKDKNLKYPLVVVLNGHYLFELVSGQMRYVNYFDDLPECIIVGVFNKNKDENLLDLSINDTEGIPDPEGAKFSEFLGLELVPFMKKNYAVSNYQVIVGHSYAAGFLNFFLLKENPLFDAYLVISPEMPYLMEERLIDNFLTIKKNISYYIASSNNDAEEVLENCLILKEGAEGAKNPLIDFYFKNFETQTHYSIAPFGVAGGLNHIFGAYQPISTIEYTEILKPLKTNQTEYLVNKYQKINPFFDREISPRYLDIQAVEASILENKNYDEFDVLASFCKKYYPKSMLEKYYTGLKFEKMGQISNAIKEYKSAFNRSSFGNINQEFLIEKIDALNKQ